MSSAFIIDSASKSQNLTQIQYKYTHKETVKNYGNKTFVPKLTQTQAAHQLKKSDSTITRYRDVSYL